ncbi:MAG: hypothetical protein ACRDXC_03890, partial [Acidimicrobiales bacterium]
AASVTGVTIGATALLLVWAHQLTSEQRNGGDGWYSAMFLAWAALVAVALAAWTVVGVSTARRLRLTRLVLRIQCALATVVAPAMALMLAATAVWWASMATEAPSFLTWTRGGAPVNPWLGLTVALMVAATSLGISGITRISRNLEGLRAA